MAGKENSIGNSNVIADFYKIVTHVVKVASHSDKGTFSDFISAPAITLDAQIVKWDTGYKYSREPLPYRFGNNNP